MPLRHAEILSQETTQQTVLSLSPIGFIQSSMKSKFDAPHQPERTGETRATIELLPEHDFEQALEDLQGFEHVWLIWWFHKNKHWKPKVVPPRGEDRKRGVFATRSPHRPNPLGLTAVRLLSISGRTLIIGDCDLIDGTPILDIKPYVPEIDSISDSKVGWLEEVSFDYSTPPTFAVTMSEKAEEQLAWLEARNIRFIDRAVSLLERDPSENRSRRIKKRQENLYRMGCAEWRIFYSVHNQEVRIEFFRPGYTEQTLLAPGFEVIPNRDYQLEFNALWPSDIF